MLKSHSSLQNLNWASATPDKSGSFWDYQRAFIMLCSQASNKFNHLFWYTFHIFNFTFYIITFETGVQKCILSFTTKRILFFSCSLPALQLQPLRFFSHVGQHNTCEIPLWYLNSINEGTQHTFFVLLCNCYKRHWQQHSFCETQNVHLQTRDYCLLSLTTTNTSHILWYIKAITVFETIHRAHLHNLVKKKQDLKLGQSLALCQEVPRLVKDHPVSLFQTLFCQLLFKPLFLTKEEF